MVADHSGDPAVVVVETVEHAAIRSMLDQLDPTTRFAVVCRFGLGHADPATYAEIGSGLGVGGEAVRRRVLRALSKLRAPAERVVA